MVNIFEVFLPQLLRYPNPTDPLNGEAAALLMRDSPKYELKVKGNTNQSICIYHSNLVYSLEYVTRYATREAADAAADDSSDDEDMSSVNFDSSEDEAAGMEL